MRKSLLLLGVFSVTAIRAEDGVGLLKFHGRAALLTDTTEAGIYTITSCTQPKVARCAGQCAEVWCDSNNIGDCALGSRSVVRVANRCATGERGDLSLPHNIFQQFSEINTDMYLFPVWWRCVDCGVNVGSHFDTKKQVVREKMRPRSGSQQHAALLLEKITVEVVHQPAKAGALRCSLSYQDIAGSSDTETDSNDRRKGNGVIDRSSGDDFFSGFGSMTGDLEWGHIDSETTTASPMSTLSSSLNHANEASSPPPPVPSTIMSSSGSPFFSGKSSSGGSGSMPSLLLAVIEDPSYSVETISFDNLQDSRDKIPSTESPYQMSDDSVDKSLSATSSVTKSPLFYASIMLGIVGLIGATVGYRAKQKRSYRDEWRAFRMFTQTRTHVYNPRPAPSSMAVLASRTRPDSRSIAIL